MCRHRKTVKQLSLNCDIFQVQPEYSIEQSPSPFCSPPLEDSCPLSEKRAQPLMEVFHIQFTDKGALGWKRLEKDKDTCNYSAAKI